MPCKEPVFLNCVNKEVLERAYLFGFRLRNCLGLAQKTTFLFVDGPLVEGLRNQNLSPMDLGSVTKDPSSGRWAQLGSFKLGLTICVNESCSCRVVLVRRLEVGHYW